MRDASNKYVKSLRLKPSLTVGPPLTTGEIIRTRDECVRRLLGANSISCIAVHYPMQQVEDWLTENGLKDALSPFESESIFRNVKPLVFFYMPYCAWSFAWALNIVPELHPGKILPDTVPANLPLANPKISVHEIFDRATLRPINELLQMLDICSCVQAAFVDQQRSGKFPNNIKVKWEWVEHQRCALQWLILDKPWDELAIGWRKGMPWN